jgi:hypothetical protein
LSYDYEGEGSSGDDDGGVGGGGGGGGCSGGGVRTGSSASSFACGTRSDTTGGGGELGDGGGVGLAAAAPYVETAATAAEIVLPTEAAFPGHYVLREEPQGATCASFCRSFKIVSRLFTCAHAVWLLFNVQWTAPKLSASSFVSHRSLVSAVLCASSGRMKKSAFFLSLSKIRWSVFLIVLAGRHAHVSALYTTHIALWLGPLRAIAVTAGC